MAAIPQFEDKFIAYVDILGFKSKVESAEGQDGLSLSDLLEYCSILSQPNISLGILEYGPTICPNLNTNLVTCITRSLKYLTVSLFQRKYHQPE